MATEQTITPEAQAELDFIDSAKTVDELSAGVTAREATQRKSLFISRHGFDAFQKLCMTSSRSYGIRK